MYNIKIITAGVKKAAQIMPLCLYEGPYCIAYTIGSDGFPKSIARLDNIENINIIDNLSTREVTTISEGEETTTSKTGNLVKRGIVGGVLLGPTGAIIGGVTGTKNTVKVGKDISTETVNYLVKLQIDFKDNTKMLVEVNDPKITELLFSHIGVEVITDEKIEKIRERCIDKINADKVKITEEAKNKGYRLKAEEKIGTYEPMSGEFHQALLVIISFSIAMLLSILTHVELSFKIFTLVWAIAKFLFYFAIAAFSVIIFVDWLEESNKKDYEKRLAEEIERQKSNNI